MAAHRPDPVALLTGALSDAPYPGGISLPGQGGKFDTGGAVMTWPGNTFVCHVARGPAYDGLRALQEKLMMSPFARFFTYLPAPSFHMTVFQGLSPGNEGTPEWPQGVAPGLDRDGVSAALDQRIADLRLAPFEIRATDLFAAHSLTVTGATPADTARMRGARLALREATGIAPPDFDDYVFHVTLAYPLQFMSPETARAATALGNEAFADFAAAYPVIPLTPCAFCDFDTMHHFAPRRVLT